MSMKTLSELTDQLDNVKGDDIDEGMAVYAEIHNLAESIATSVSNWMFRTTYSFWEQNDKIGTEEISDSFKKVMQGAIDRIINLNGQESFNNANGENTLKLSGENPLSSAFRKMNNGLKMGINFDKHGSVRAVQDEVTRINKESKVIQDTANIEKQIKSRLEGEIVEANPILGNEGNEELLAAEVEKQYDAYMKDRDADIELAKRRDVNEKKYPMPKCAFDNEMVAKAIAELVEAMALRIPAHCDATNVPESVAVEQLVKSIEGETGRQLEKVAAWNEQIEEAKAKLLAIAS